MANYCLFLPESEYALMSKLKKFCAIFLLISIGATMLLFSGCSLSGEVTPPDPANNKKAPALILPEEIYGPNEGGSGALGTYQNVRVYLDNTWGLRGFLLADTGRESDFLKVMKRLVGMTERYNEQSFYSLVDYEGQFYASWEKFSLNDFNYRAESFYSVTRRLQNPFSSPESFDDGLTIYVTDLDEGADENVNLANTLSKKIMETDKDRSALLYCFPVAFYGNVWKDTGAVDTEGRPIQDAIFADETGKPFYVVVFGPTREILRFRDDFAKEVAGDGFSSSENEAGKPYYCAQFLSGRGMEAGEAILRTTPLTLKTTIKEDDPWRKEYTFDNSDIDYDMFKIPSENVFPDVDQTLPGLFYGSTKISGLFSSRYSGDMMFDRRFSFVADLPQQTNFNEEIKYKIDYDVYYANESTLKSAEDEPPAEAFDKMEKGGSQYYRLLDETLDSRMLTVKIEDFVGTIQKERIKEEDFDLFSDSKKEKADRIVTVQSAYDNVPSYYITIETKDGFKLQDTYDALIFVFTVTGEVEISDDNTPEWIKKYNAGSESLSEHDKVICAKDLKYIYDHLNGSMMNENEKQTYADHMTTKICSFPVLIDFRDVKY